MKLKFLNRNFPVFFISRCSLLILITFLLVNCKAKTDWRDNYKKKSPDKSSVKTVDSPKSTEDIAALLAVDKNNLKNKELYRLIQDWYGTPYVFGGQSERGIDCSGFTNVIYKEIYRTQIPRISKDIAENIKRKYVKDLEEGDLVFFSFGNTGTINHVGVYLLNNKFVHASTSKGVIISDLTEPWYEKALVKCGSYKN